MTISEAFERLVNLAALGTGGSEAAVAFLKAYKQQTTFDLRLVFKLDYKNKQAIATLLPIMGREEYWEVCKLIEQIDLKDFEEEEARR